jgi:DNA-binding NtrC family response regulator
MKGGADDYVTKPIDVRRLRLLVAKAVEFQKVVAENEALRRRLPEPAVGIEGQADPLTAREGESATCAIHPGMTIAECEKLLIRQTLVHATPNRERAARLLGISRRALQYKLKSYGLLVPRRQTSPGG